MYQFGMKDLISLHSCISSGSDISAESDHYISLALHLLRQSGINLTTQKVAQVKSATSKSSIGPLLKKDIGNAGILLLSRCVTAVDLWVRLEQTVTVMEEKTADEPQNLLMNLRTHRFDSYDKLIYSSHILFQLLLHMMHTWKT